MAYTLQAFIGDLPDLKQHAPSGAVIVSLDQGKGMIPLGDDFRRLHKIPFLPMTDDGWKEIPSAIKSITENFKGSIAYVEAEFFGSGGTQAAVIWKEGDLIFGPLVNVRAINQALRILGVTKGTCFDEFDALGLGKHRGTNGWIRSSNVQ